MAKSTRSKVKRHYRAKKREDGVYAAIEAARLERLSAKLAVVKNSGKIAAIDGEDEKEEQERIEKEDEAIVEAGSLWYLAFGLLDPSHVSYDSLDCLSQSLERSFC